MTITPEYYIEGLGITCSFIGGALYKHEANTVYGEFYGYTFPQQIKCVGNAMPDKVKVYDALIVNSSKGISKQQFDYLRGVVTAAQSAYDAMVALPGDAGQIAAALATLTAAALALDNYIKQFWRCTDEDYEEMYITVPYGEFAQTEMTSRLKPTKFVYKEGVSYAAFDRDSTTNRAAATIFGGLTLAQCNAIDRLINGRKLRGRVIYITLENSSETEIVLDAVYIKCTDSERTLK